MKKFFQFLSSYLRSAPRIILFEFIFKLMVSAIAVPVISILLDRAMKLSGAGFFPLKNLPKFLLYPGTIPIILLIFIIIGFTLLFEISSLTVSAAYSCKHRKIGIFSMFKCGVRGVFKGLRGRGIFGMTGLALNLGAAQVILYSGLAYSSAVDHLGKWLGIFALPAYILVVFNLELIMAWMISRRSYTIHFLTLTKSDYSQAVKKSRKCLNGRRFRTALILLLWAAVALGAAAAVTFLVSFLIIFAVKGFSNPEYSFLTALRVLSYAGKILYALLSIVVVPFVIYGLTNRFLQDETVNDKIILPDPEEKKMPRPLKIGATAVIMAVGIYLNFSYIQAAYRGNLSLNTGIFTRTHVTAHRGFSYAAPENTIYAFQAAIDINADFIELDVQQTKDGMLVVFHDDTMERTTGIRGKIGDFTYDELKNFSAGSWFKREGEDFSDAEIMLLSDVMELAMDNGIMLNIEVKKSEDTVDTAKKAAAMVLEYNMDEMCYITSFEHSALKAVKEIQPDLRTALIIGNSAPLAYADIKYIDGISINYVFVNTSLVRSFHFNNKKVFVWTVNSRGSMDRLISMGVDNIITDRPDIAGEAVYSYDKGDFILSILENIFY